MTSELAFPPGLIMVLGAMLIPLLGERQGRAVLSGGEGTVQRRMLVGPVTRAVLIHQVEIAVGGDLGSDEGQNTRGFLRQPRHHQVSDQQPPAS